MQEEYGSSDNIRFPNCTYSGLYYQDGSPVLCKCGKPATEALIGKESYLARCKDCSDLKLDSGHLIFKETVDIKELDDIEVLSDCCNAPLRRKMWVVLCSKCNVILRHNNDDDFQKMKAKNV